MLRCPWYIELKWLTDCLSSHTNKLWYQPLKLGTIPQGSECPWTLSIAKYVRMYLDIIAPEHFQDPAP